MKITLTIILVTHLNFVFFKAIRGWEIRLTLFAKHFDRILSWQIKSLYLLSFKNLIFYVELADASRQHLIKNYLAYQNQTKLTTLLIGAQKVGLSQVMFGGNIKHLLILVHKSTFKSCETGNILMIVFKLLNLNERIIIH